MADLTRKIFFEEKYARSLNKNMKPGNLWLEAIDKAFGPFKKKLKRAITRDILNFTEKPVRRIYEAGLILNRYKGIEAEIKHDLEHLTD